MPVLHTAEIERVFRQEAGRAVAVLVGRFGDIDIAEEAVQEAFLQAVQRWPVTGLPPSTAGWIITTARNRAIDRLRRESSRGDRQAAAEMLRAREPDAVEPVEDDRLRLIFTCCHPALSTEAQIALTLRLLGGLQTSQIAKAFLVPEPTMAQRLVRAKAKIRAAHIPYRVPGEVEMASRLPPVLAVVYLIFNEGYTSTSEDDPPEGDLCTEAIRLGRILAELMADQAEVLGLLALMLISEARRHARVAGGDLVLLADQDRDLWNRELIAEGQTLVRVCLRRQQPGPYQIQAAISAVHSDASVASDTDWSQILELYDQLLEVAPGPVVALNRAVAVAEVQGPEEALTALEGLQLDNYHLFHATRAECLRRLNRDGEASVAYETAVALIPDGPQRRFLEHRRETLSNDR